MRAAILATIATLISTPAFCAVDYARLFEDGSLDITIALGFDENNDPHATELDPGQRARDVAAFESEIFGCKECGFKLRWRSPGARLYKATVDYNGKKIATHLLFIFQEKGVSQKALKDAFLQSIAHDDVVIYDGHSREGAGFPDFGPKSRTDGKVFRPISGANWSGFESGQFAKDKYQIFMMNSCKSRKYYEKVLRKFVTNKPAHLLGLILTNDDPQLDDYPRTTMELIRGLMLQNSPGEILKEMDQVAYYSSYYRRADAGPLFYSSEF